METVGSFSQSGLSTLAGGGRAVPEREDSIELPVQINGKTRASIKVPVDATKEAILQLARDDETVARFINGGTIRREIYVPGRIVNLVVSS